MKTSHPYQFAAPVARVAEVLCSEAFNVAFDEEREDAVKSRFEVVERGEHHHVFVVHTTEYKRSPLGKIDRSGTVQSRTTHRWDDRRQTLTWDYRGHETGRIDIRGVYRLSPRDGGTLVLHEYSIEVQIPLIGNQIAKLIDREFREVIPRFESAIKRFL